MKETVGKSERAKYLSYNCNFPTGIQFAENKLSELDLISGGKKKTKKNFNPET